MDGLDGHATRKHGRTRRVLALGSGIAAAAAAVLAAAVPLATALDLAPDRGPATVSAERAGSPMPTRTGGPFSAPVTDATVDLSVDASDFPDPVATGGALTYSISVFNDGPGAATTVQLSNDLPNSVALVSATPDAGGSCGTGDPLVCTWPSLAAGDGGFVDIVVTAPGTAQALSFTATASSSDTESNGTDNSATVTTNVVVVADLQLTKNASPAQVAPGQTLTYTLTLTNDGPAPATGVTLVDNLPDTFTFSSVSPTPACSHSLGTVTCNLGTLASGANSIVTIQGTPTAGGELFNFAQASATEHDPDGATDSTATTVLWPEDVAVTKADSTDPISVGGTTTYTITVENEGANALTGVVATDTLPAGMSFVSSLSGCTPVAQVVTCSFGGLAPAQTKNATFVATATTGGTKTNSVTVTANEGDDDSADNTATETTRVRDSALDIARAMIEDESWLTSASFVTIPPEGNPNMVATTPLAGFPRHGPKYALLTSGDAELADDPDNSEGSGEAIGGGAIKGTGDRDVSILKVDLNVPSGMNCVTVNFRFLSEEYPEFVGSSYNDAFIAEVGTNDWTTDASTITAPSNFAFDQDGKPITINSLGFTQLSEPAAAGTTYDGATPLLSASKTIGTGAQTLYFSIFDVGDQILDSAVMLDLLRLSNAAPGSCVAGATILSATKVADAATSPSGGTNGYTISVANAHTSPFTISSIVDDLPAGFSYVPGSTTGITTANPTIAGQKLTWNGPFTLPASGALTLSFDVTVATAPGTYLNSASVQGDGVSITPTGSTAPIKVLPTVSIADAAKTEGNAGSSNLTFTASLNGPSTDTVTVGFATAAGTAQAPGDYTHSTGTVTFNPGETSKPVTVPIVGDTVYEPDESFTVTLSAPVNATLADASAVGTIQNDDTAPSLSINDVSVTEGNSGTTSLSFTVSKTGATAVAASAAWATANGTAVAPGDYAAVTGGAVSLDPGETSKQITVAVVGETVFEANETFTVTLSSPSHATIGDGTGQGTITNDDAAPTLAIDDVSLTEGNAGTKQFTFTVTKTGLTGLPASVTFATANGTAIAPGDYAATSGPLTFAAGETSKPVTVLVNGDTVFEADETFTVGLSGASGATVTDASGLGTIQNDDVSGVAVSIADESVLEGNSGTTPTTFDVTLSEPSGSTVTVGWATSPGTATASADYATLSGTVTFVAGDTAETVTVSVVGETVFEANETFTVTLSSPSGAAIGDGSATGTIQNDDAAPQLSIGDNVSTSEGNSGTKQFSFTVTKTGATELAASATVNTANGTAVAPGDYVALSGGSVSLAPGEASKQVTVLVNGDTVFEANETFTVVLSAPANATLGDASGLGAIQNDDSTPTLSVGDVSAAEGNAGTTSFSFTVSKTGATELSSSADFTTAGGTAAAGGDYTTATGTVTFAPGETTKQVVVQVVGDQVFEANETFAVTLSNLSQATPGDVTGQGTIQNDDAAPVLSVGDRSLPEGNLGTTSFTFTVTKAGATALSASVDFATFSGTAIQPVDFTSASGPLTFGPGETSKTVTVLVNGDTNLEPNETFTLRLSNAAAATIGDDSGLGTIENDDVNTAPVVNAGQDTTLAEGQLFARQGGAADPDTQSWTATVDYGDGSGVQPLPLAAGPTFLLSHTYADNGVYTITVTVNDGLASDSDSVLVTITNVVPTTDAGPDQTLTAGAGFSSSGSFTDPGAGDTWTATVDYGDGTGVQPLTLNPDKTFALSHLYAAAGSYTVTVVVRDDDGGSDDDTAGVTVVAQPQVSVGDVTVTEGNSGTTNASFQVTLSVPTSGIVTVGYATANGTATAPGDYQAATGTLSFPAGTTTLALTVPVIGDTLDESNETFDVNLSSPSGATIADGQGVGTITDDDVAPSGPCDITGTAGPDTLTGTGAGETICGLGGNDRITGGGGNDVITGGSGNDRIRGGSGNDRIKGEAGNDDLAGEGGNDDVEGGSGNDELDGGSGGDSMEGGAGNDAFVGASGNDTVDGGAGNDSGTGGSGADTMVGGDGKDTFSGSSDKDKLYGRGGNDKLRGGGGNDLLRGEGGFDKLNGEGGTDDCNVGPGGGTRQSCEIAGSAFMLSAAEKPTLVPSLERVRKAREARSRAPEAGTRRAGDYAARSTPIARWRR